MPVGIPGTVLGCTFYWLLVCVMPVLAAVRTWLGKGRVEEWRSALRHVAILLAIFGVMYVEGLCLRAGAHAVLWLLPADSTLRQTINEAVQTVSPALALLPFFLIGALALGLALLRMEIVWWENVRKRAALNVAPAATFAPTTLAA